jgi:heme O synthase-like polyprenyltransferase
VNAEERPAFYALQTGGWRDYVTLLHPPYTLWHLSYVVVGGCLAPTVSWSRLALTMLAFFLALGVGAHALDELAGRPLRTAIPRWMLVALAFASVATACAIGVAVAVDFSLWILPLVVAGALLVPAYTLELAGGRFHTDLWFGLAWGAFPVVTGYVACAGAVEPETAIAAAWATVLSLAQRRLSTSARHARRRVEAVRGELELAGGGSEPITRATLVAAPEGALRLLTWSTVLIAAALVALRL